MFVYVCTCACLTHPEPVFVLTQQRLINSSKHLLQPSAKNVNKCRFSVAPLCFCLALSRSLFLSLPKREWPRWANDFSFPFAFDLCLQYCCVSFIFFLLDMFKLSVLQCLFVDCGYWNPAFSAPSYSLWYPIAGGFPSPTKAINTIFPTCKALFLDLPHSYRLIALLLWCICALPHTDDCFCCW